MSVNKIEKIIALSIILICNSCISKYDVENDNTYQIVNLLANYYSKSNILEPSFPPPPNNLKYNFTTKDSLKIYKHFYQESMKEQVIAIRTKMYSPKEKIVSNKKCNGVEAMLKTFKNLKEKSFDFSKIQLLNKNSIVVKESELIQKLKQVDIKFSFSRIGFNKTYDKAILVLNVNFGKLNSFNTLIYLEKVNFVWNIICEEELSIS